MGYSRVEQWIVWIINPKNEGRVWWNIKQLGR